MKRWPYNHARQEIEVACPGCGAELTLIYVVDGDHLVWRLAEHERYRLLDLTIKSDHWVEHKCKREEHDGRATNTAAA